jgi:hypothetical protein
MIDDLDRIMAVMETAFDPAYGEAWTRRQVDDALAFGNCHYRLIGADGLPPAAGASAAGFALSRFTFDEEELLLFAIVPRNSGAGDWAVACSISSPAMPCRAARGGWCWKCGAAIRQVNSMRLSVSCRWASAPTITGRQMDRGSTRLLLPAISATDSACILAATHPDFA